MSLRLQGVHREKERERGGVIRITLGVHSRVLRAETTCIHTSK